MRFKMESIKLRKSVVERKLKIFVQHSLVNLCMVIKTTSFVMLVNFCYVIRILY